MRPDKASYYLDIARIVSSRSTCLRRQYGSVIVKNDMVVSTGYNGSPRGCPNCCDIGTCWRDENNIPRGTRVELCRATGVHSEANAIINAGRERCINATLYLYGYDMAKHHMVEHIDSCQACKRAIINAGIDEVVFAKTSDYNTERHGYDYTYRKIKVKTWVETDAVDPDPNGY